jgi:hypothetical protein
MPKTLLQIINQVQGELGIPQTSPIVGNPDPSTLQLYNLLIGLTTELRRMKLWTVCQWEMIIEVPPASVFVGDTAQNSNQIINISPPLATFPQLVPQLFVADVPSIPTECRVAGVDFGNNILTLNMVATVNQTQVTFQLAQDTFSFPPDFDFFQNRTMWDRTNRWELLGPDSPQMDQWHRSGIVVTGPRRHFRKLGPYSNGQFRVWPSPLELVTNMQLVFEYMSQNCVAVAGSASEPMPAFAMNFTTDTDTPLLDDDLLIKGLKWKFWEIKGFNFADMKNDWLDYVDEMYARDGSRKTLNLVKRVNPIFLSPANVSDGFYPGPIGPNAM